jgi:hypothetical protein
MTMINTYEAGRKEGTKKENMESSSQLGCAFVFYFIPYSPCLCLFPTQFMEILILNIKSFIHLSEPL